MKPGAIKQVAAHQFERQAADWYIEPNWVSERLFEEEPFISGVYDPCCGLGRIPEAARAAGLSIRAGDLVDRGYKNMTHQGDFLDLKESPMPNIIFNPPFNVAEKLTSHAIALASQKVAIIFPTARLNAAHWLRLGAPLVRVWLLTPRPSMPPGEIIARGEKPGGGKVDFCWLVFDRAHCGAPELRWLHRDKEK